MAAVKGGSTPVLPFRFAEGATAGGSIPAALPCWDPTSSVEPRLNPRFIAIVTRRRRGRILRETNDSDYLFLSLVRTLVGTEGAEQSLSVRANSK